MVKARQAHFNAQILDGQFRVAFYGTGDDLALCVEQGAEELLERHPELRRKLRRAMLTATMPEWVSYLLRDWQATLLGAAVLTLAVAGFCWIVHGVCGV